MTWIWLTTRQVAQPNEGGKPCPTTEVIQTGQPVRAADACFHARSASLGDLESISQASQPDFVRWSPRKRESMKLPVHSASGAARTP